jgi:hypothetical protein
MKNVWIPVLGGAALILTGCTSTMPNNNPEGLKNTACKNGVCIQKPQVISTKDAAPIPTVLPPLLHTTEKALFAQ